MKISKEKEFLVFSGGNDRAVMGFLRALRLCGRRAHIVARTPDDQILQSEYRHDVKWIRPTNRISMDTLSESINKASVGAGTLVILPSTEYFNNFLLKNRREIEAMGCEIPLVDADLYMRLTQKGSAVRFFSAAGLSVPLEISAPVPMEKPFVAKPIRNISASGQSLYPHLLDTPRKLNEFLSAYDVKDYFFQEHVQGENLYLLFHISQNEGRDFLWSQRNLIQQPNGKSMLLAESASFHESETAARIIRALRHAGFHGLGMVEVIRRDDREVFIEMNPRIWGPVQFSLDQRKPLLQAFIGEALYGDPLRFVHCLPRFRRRRYFWLGGLLQTLVTRQSPTWHCRTRSLFFLEVLRNIVSDVYLRRDSWRCFLREILRTFNMREDR